FTRLEGLLGNRAVCGLVSSIDIRISPTSGGVLVLELDGGSSATETNVNSVKAVRDGTFHHVAVVRQGTTASIYIDGVLDATAGNTTVPNIVSAVPLIAGKSGCTGVDGTVFFQGLLDELEIFHRALAPSEIQAVFA